MTDTANWRPVPDPTVLTTEQLLREIGTVRGEIDAAITLLRSEASGHQMVDLERFAKVEQQFELVERQRVEQKADTKAAVDAALTAQKEAVKEQTTASALAIAKSETGTKEQLKALSDTFATAISGISKSLDDLKDRVVRIETAQSSRQEARTESGSSLSRVIAGASVTVAMIAIIAAVLVAVLKP